MTISPPPVVVAERRSLRREIAEWLFLWVPAVIGLVALVCCAIALLSQGSEPAFYLTFLLFMWLPIGTVVLGTLALLGTHAVLRFRAWRRNQRAMTILTYLENAIRLNLPLDPFLRAAQESEPDVTRWRIGELRHALSRGMPISHALADSVPEVSSDLLGSLNAAESIGQLEPTLARLMRRESSRQADFEQASPPFYRFYIQLLLIATVGMTMFFEIFVVPKFRDIFKDFHTTLPWVTQMLMDVSTWVADDYGWTLFIVPLLFILFATIARAVQRSVQRVRGVRRTRTFFPGYDAIPWFIPVWRKLLRDRAMASVLEFLADALRAGLPLPRAVGAALVMSLPPAIRRRLESWHDLLLAGKSPGDAASIAGLPELLTGFLQSPPATKNSAQISATSATPELFDFLATYYRDRFSRLGIFLRAAAQPASVLVIGAFVGLLVYAMFSPLVKLIQSVTGWDGVL